MPSYTSEHIAKGRAGLRLNGRAIRLGRKPGHKLTFVQRMRVANRYGGVKRRYPARCFDLAEL